MRRAAAPLPRAFIYAADIERLERTHGSCRRCTDRHRPAADDILRAGRFRRCCRCLLSSAAAASARDTRWLTSSIAQPFHAAIINIAQLPPLLSEPYFLTSYAHFHTYLAAAAWYSSSSTRFTVADRPHRQEPRRRSWPISQLHSFSGSTSCLEIF